MNKRKLGFLTLGLVSLSAVTVIGAKVGTNYMSLGRETTTWRHFEAVKETYSTRGIKEYWTDCIGGEPVFEAPEGITPIEGGVPSLEFINSLSLDDPRLIPAMKEYDRIQTSSLLQYVNSSNAYELVANENTIDDYYGPIHNYDLAAKENYSQNNAFYFLTASDLAKFNNKDLKLYIYSDIDFIVNYTEGTSWTSYGNKTIEAGKWNVFSFEASVYNDKPAKGGYLYFTAPKGDLKALGTIKVTDFIVAKASAVRDVTPSIDFTYNAGNDIYPAIPKTTGSDSEIGDYFEYDLSSIGTQYASVAARINAQACANFGDEIYFYVYAKESNKTKVIVQEGKDWSGVTVFCNEGWNKVSVNSSIISKAKTTDLYINIFNFGDAISLQDIGMFRVSHIFSPIN